MKKHTTIYILCIFIAIGFLLRIVNLNTIPNGFHVDELDAGYIGRYIWTHGKDILGNVLPLTYNKFGDYRATGVFYLSGLSALLFGSNEFAVRLPIALLGAATVATLFLCARELFESKKTGLFAAAALAILPWHIVLSRATSEGIAGLFFVCLGLGLLLRAGRLGSIKLFCYGTISLTFSYIFYHSFRLLVPFMLIPFLWHTNVFKINKKIIIGTVSFFFLLTIIMSFTGFGKGRLDQVVFYKDPSLPAYIQSLNNADGPTSIMMARIFHNKVTVYSQVVLHQYFKYFSTEFLVLQGGLPARYNVPEQGLIYISFFVLMVGGLLALFRFGTPWSIIFIIYLFIIAPIPATITFEDTPNMHRALMMILPITLAVSYGLSTISNAFKKYRRVYKTILSLGCIIIVLEVINFWHFYSEHSKSYQSFTRNDGFSELIHTVLANKGKYTKIYLPGYDNIPLYYLFYTTDYQNLSFKNTPNDVMLNQRDNVFFVPDWCPSIYLERTNQLEPSILIADREECKMVAHTGIEYTIKRQDHTKAFILNTYYQEAKKTIPN